VTLLLDTHTLLWWRAGSRKLGRRARRAIDRDAVAVHVSAVVVWEIAIKVRGPEVANDPERAAALSTIAAKAAHRCGC
jgi:PIN domain nuclease of toxin-antitoxin system